MSQTSRTPSSRKHYSLIIVASVIFGLLIAGVLSETTEQAYLEELHGIGEERLNLYTSTVEAEHKRFDYLPYIVAQDYQVLQLLSAQESNPQNSQRTGTDIQLSESSENSGAAEITITEAVNRKLESWQRESGADALYLMNREGLVVASSNWMQPGSFMGNDYHFRPYFKDAIAGNAGRFFAVGVTTGQPGLFLSRPVTSQGRITGVAVLKINMSVLEANWNAGGEDVWVSDSDGIIFLSSNPLWQYRSLVKLAPHVHARLSEARKYSHHPIEPLLLKDLPSSPQGNRIISLTEKGTEREAKPSTRTYLLHHREIADLNWTLYYLTDLKELAKRKRNALVISALVTALIALVGIFLISRHRHQQQLEWRVMKRTEELNRSNTRLKLEVEERIRTEKALRQTHEELIQAEKLGALGQLSAELVHEISQPLQATLTFLASTKLLAERGNYQLVEENLSEIDKLIRRVSGIVTHLKTFASKSRGTLSRVELRQVIDNALMVLSASLDKSGIELVWSAPAFPVSVHADEIKLEQILVNLIRNAIDAINSADNSVQGLITVGLETSGGEARITVSDNGCGIDPDHVPMLFDPFFTTKPPGKGMGLGLSVSYGIIEEFGGRLSVEPDSDKGTTFSVALSLIPTEQNHE